MKRSEDEYTYLEWDTAIRSSIDIVCDLEIMRISHDDEDERPWELINKIKNFIVSFEKQIPD